VLDEGAREGRAGSASDGGGRGEPREGLGHGALRCGAVSHHVHARVSGRDRSACEEQESAEAVAERVGTFARLARFARPALVNGAAGVVVAPRGRPVAVAGFTVAHGKIVEIDLLADPARLRELDLTVLDD
jgi:hypothetical protein